MCAKTGQSGSPHSRSLPGGSFVLALTIFVLKSIYSDWISHADVVLTYKKNAYLRTQAGSSSLFCK